ncbi:MAG: AIM24 family protein [Actinomycetota bacterium]|nr:AIM24 family protein [Actinomycetota bacterium]
MRTEIKGTTMPVLEVFLDRGEEIISAHGELSWMTPTMAMQTKSGAGGGAKGLLSGLKRIAGGGSLFVTHYTASTGPGMVAFASKVPGHIKEVQITPGNGYMVHRHGWLAGTDGIIPTIGFQQSFRAGLFGGDGFILQRLDGQGTAWIELSGETVEYDLQAGETILVHPGHVGLFQETISFNITQIQGLSNIFFGGDGYHLVALTGPGKLYLQSMPLPLLAHSIYPYLPQPRN